MYRETSISHYDYFAKLEFCSEILVKDYAFSILQPRHLSSHISHIGSFLAGIYLVTSYGVIVTQS